MVVFFPVFVIFIIFCSEFSTANLVCVGRYKVGDMGVKQAEPRLELKKHRRQSRKRMNQSIMAELDELDDDEDENLFDEDDPIVRAMRDEHQ